MKGVVFLFAVFVCAAQVQGACEEKECLPCVSSDCWFCGGAYGTRCVVDQHHCPNLTTFAIPNGYPEECPSTTTTPPPSTSPKPTTFTNILSNIGLVFVCFVGVVLLLLITTFILYLHTTCQEQEQQQPGLGDRPVFSLDLPLDEDNEDEISFEALHNAESNGNIVTHRGPHSYADEEELFSRNVEARDMTPVLPDPPLIKMEVV